MTELEKTNKETLSSAYIVGIGASAGGLNALEQFFDNMPPDSGMAFVVIQHLSPDFKSLMDDLLSRHTSMRIHRVTSGIELQPDSIYLIPPRTVMTIKDEKLYLTEKVISQHLELPIDIFFNSLANDAGVRAIGIILSGTGSDGSRGIQSIHNNGGLVLAQSPESAQFDGMPRSAIASGVCDVVIAPDLMPRILVEYAISPLMVRCKMLNTLDVCEDEGEFAQIFALMRRSYHLDFSKYKITTVGRRIKRRMDFCRIPAVSDYASILSGNPSEMESLYKDLLIGVTEFFRDKQSFLFLEKELIPDLFSKLKSGEDLRVWSAPCATGEEAYSLAILLAERAGETGFIGKITVFATDVHKTSLEIASQGIYDRERLTNVSHERLERYFKKEGTDLFRVTSELRKLVVFAPHNLLKDPPFTRLDLVCCRNLLIYFQPEAQEKVLSLFHFALKTGCVLFLGSSEGLGPFADEFEVIASQHKMFRKIRELKLAIDLDVIHNNKERNIPLTVFQPVQSRMVSMERQMLHNYDLLLRKHIPPGVLLNENRHITHYFGNVSEYLKMPEGRIENDILLLVEDNLHIALSTALLRATKVGQSIVTRNVRVRRDKEEFLIDLTVDPLPDEKTRTTHYHVYFDRLRTAELSHPQVELPDELDENHFDTSGNFRQHIADLEIELQSTRENLQTTVEELQTSNEELQATNEEMLASNEELQSTNEELHSVNEELYSVNSEFERKNIDLKLLNTDHDNLLTSIDVGTIFLDRQMRIRKFNPAIAAFFKLLPQDTGRPIDHIAYRLSRQEELLSDINRVMNDNNPLESEECTRDGKWLLIRIMPFRTETGQVEGVVITFTDISCVKAAEQGIIRLNEELEQKVVERTSELHHQFKGRIEAEHALNESLEKYKVLFDSFPLGIIITDRVGKVMETNRSSWLILETTKTELERLAIDGNDWKFLRQDMTVFTIDEFPAVKALRENRLIENIVVGIENTRNAITWINMTVVPIPLEKYGVAIAFNDITGHKDLEEQLLHSQKMEAIGQLAGGVAHDFNNILQVILGHCAMLQTKMPQDNTDRHAIHVISEAAERAASLTRRLLAFSRKQVMIQKIVNLNDILHNTEPFLRRLIGEHIRFETDISAEPLNVYCDSNQIEQALINLATNAQDAMPNGGVLTIRSGRCDLDEATLLSHGQGTPGRYAFVTLSDSGSGMDEKTRRRIFEPFFTTKQLGRGTGLGLAIVYGIIKQHDGFIDMVSEPQEGTVFTLYLPLRSEQELTREPTYTMHPQTGNETILVAEDDPQVRSLTAEILSDFGYTVITAEDGQDAVEQFIAQQEQIKLLVLDAIMPRKNGMKAYEEIKAIQPGIAALFISGYTAEFIQTHGEVAAGVEFVMKPINTMELVRKVRKALDSKSDSGTTLNT